MKKIAITEEAIQYIIDSIYNKIIENNKIPVPDSSQIKLDYARLSDVVLSRIPKVISNEIKVSFDPAKIKSEIKELKVKLDSIEEKLNEDKEVIIDDKVNT